MDSRRERTVRARMAATRARILDTARAIITRDGVSALTARALARSGAVSLATLYSLVGKREEVLSALFAQTQDRVRERMAAHGEVHGLARVELLVTETARLFGEDEVYYKAAQLAMEHLDEAPVRAAAVAAAYASGDAMIRAGVRECARAGLLLGRVPLAVLEDMAIQCYRGSYRRWSSGQLSTAAVRRATLLQSYAILLADAGDDLRATLHGRLAELADASE